MSGDSHTSGGVTINADVVNIGGDVVGRDSTALPQAAPAQAAEPAPVFRLLVIVSRPLDVNELPAIADQWRLVQGLQTVNAPVAVKVLRPPTLDGLRTELLAGYDVIHFDGHGDYGHVCPGCDRYVSSDEDEPPTHCPTCDTSLKDAQAIGLLFFEKEDGTFDVLSASDFAQLITSVPDRPTKLVVLSACRSAMGDDHSLAQTLVNAGVPSVLGMKEVVTVEATLKFFQPFYAALGAGETIEEAKHIACDALKRVNNPRTDTPAAELPLLIGPGVKAVLCPKGSHKGREQIETDRLVGVPDAANFYGLFIKDDPPRGRKGLLVQLARTLLSGQRLVAFVGTGGIGKTWLASVGARRLAWRFPGGVFWRSAADIADFRLDHLLDAFAPIFGQQFYTLPTPAKRDLVLQYLRDLRSNVLIVVDNAETIKDESVRKFLTELPDPSAAIITTREAPEYGCAVIDVSGMDREESVNLFIMEGNRAKNAA